MKASFDPHPDYLRVTLSGAFEAAASPPIIDAVVREARRLGQHRILCDMTGMTNFDGVTPFRARLEAGLVVIRLLPTSFRLAFVEASDHVEEARFGDTVFANRAGHVKVTTSEAEAVAWLLQR